MQDQALSVVIEDKRVKQAVVHDDRRSYPRRFVLPRIRYRRFVSGVRRSIVPGIHWGWVRDVDVLGSCFKRRR